MIYLGEPILKPFAIAMVLVIAAIGSQSVWAAKGGKPDPGPIIAADVSCIGCVDTVDIADGAVTTDKVSTELLDMIIQLNDRIDMLEARPSLPTAIDGNGSPIGQILNAEIRNDASYTVDYYMTIYTDKGYMVGLNHRLGVPHSRKVYFTGNNCSGNAYIPVLHGIGPGWVIQAGQKTSQTANPNRSLDAYYVPLDAASTDTSVSLASSLNEGYCSTNLTGAFFPMYEVFPNDPNITGMQNELYTLPIRPAK